jgi:predicted aspartyl protease
MRGRKLCCLTLLTLLTVAGETVARANQKAPKAWVGFHLYHDYLIVAQGSAGPLKGLNFLVDTGASPTVLDRQLAQRLGLDELPGSIVFVNGRVPAGQATVPSLELGPMRRHNLPILVEDLSFFESALPVHIDGVIGLDVLGQSAFEIDYTRWQIRFGSFRPLANSLPLRIEAGLPIIEAELNHLAVHLLLDTGASSLLLFEPRSGPILPQKISAVGGSSSTIGEFQGKQVWLRSLRLGEKEFGRQPAFIVRSPPGNQDRTLEWNFDGLISPAGLGMSKVAVDVERGVLAFSR